MGGGAWWAAVHGVAKSDTTECLHFHALKKEMTTHSSVLAWRIPGTGEPGGLPSMGSHRVGHNWSDLATGPPYIRYESYFMTYDCTYSGISVKISWNHVNAQNLFLVLFNGNRKNICFCLLPGKALGKAKSLTGTEEMFTFSCLITVCCSFILKFGPLLKLFWTTTTSVILTRQCQVSLIKNLAVGTLKCF